MVYEVDLVNLNDTIGNTVNVIFAPSEVREGLTSMADFDGDGQLEVVCFRDHLALDGGAWIWNPRNVTLLSSAPGENRRLSLPSISDLDGDCLLEIIVNKREELTVYSFDGSPTLSKVYSHETNDLSGITGVAVFDLNQDGRQEIIYRDQTEFVILDGPTGDVLYTYPIFSGTINEQPIIADVDNDGSAEILIHGGLEDQHDLRMFCFESATTPWAPARRVWNQAGYHVTNVNDDLTIPQYQQSTTAFFDTDSCFAETCPQVYNTFGVQATYRTQKGCQVFEEVMPDAISILAVDTIVCIGDSLTLSIVTEEEEIDWYASTPVDCIDCYAIRIPITEDVWVRAVVGQVGCTVEDSIFIACLLYTSPSPRD